MANNTNQSKRGGLLRTGKLLLITGVSLMLTVSAFAQDNFDGDPDDPVPFDGGISLLAAAGVAYGVKQWHNKRKENNAPDGDAEVKE